MDCFVPQVGCLTISIFICGLRRSQAEKTFQQWASSSVTKTRVSFTNEDLFQDGTEGAYCGTLQSPL